MSGPPNERGRGRGRRQGTDRSAGGLLGNYFGGQGAAGEQEEVVEAQEARPHPTQERAPSPPPRGVGARDEEPAGAGEADQPDAGEASPDFAVEALRDLLDYDDPPRKKTQRSFQLPAKYTTALKLMQAHLQDNGGFTASEASMSNLVAAMINQWHEGMFGRPIDR